MSKLNELISLCKGGIYILVNDHLSGNETIQEHLGIIGEYVPADTLAEMIKTNTVVTIQAFPYAADSFYSASHYNIEGAASLALEQLKAERN